MGTFKFKSSTKVLLNDTFNLTFGVGEHHLIKGTVKYWKQYCECETVMSSQKVPTTHANIAGILLVWRYEQCGSWANCMQTGRKRGCLSLSCCLSTVESNPTLVDWVHERLVEFCKSFKHWSSHYYSCRWGFFKDLYKHKKCRNPTTIRLPIMPYCL